jgi:hypothetical protein
VGMRRKQIGLCGSWMKFRRILVPTKIDLWASCAMILASRALSGFHFTTNDQLRTGTDKGNPTV